MAWSRLLRRLALALLPALLAGCDRAGAPSRQVVIYTSVDQVFAAQVLAEFERMTGIRVEAVFDTEAGKTTGFLRRLVREQPRPRCDVWWSSEVFGTIELAGQGVLAPYHTAVVADVAGEWRAPDGLWNSTAARARVLAYHPERVRAEQLPATWRELADSPLVGRMAIANPQFGTTRGHVAAMFAYWGAAPATAYLQKLRDGGAIVADGNAHVVRMLASGQADICWTDTDDVWSAQARGERIELVYLDLDDGLPPIWIPSSAALVRGGPHPAAGKQLLEYLLSAAVERALYASDSRNVPVRDTLRADLAYEGPPPRPLDFSRVTAALPEAMEAARRILLE